MASDILKLADESQYTFQIIEDGSILQIYYSYASGGNTIRSASLGFYRAVPDLDARTDEDFFREEISERVISQADEEADDVLLEVLPIGSTGDESRQSEVAVHTIRNDRDTPVSWLRIDYEPADGRGVLHHDCHLHISSFPYTRFVVAGLPSPKQFVELIIASFYPKIYQLHRLDEKWQYADESKIASVHSDCFRLPENALYKQMMHFRIPTS